MSKEKIKLKSPSDIERLKEGGAILRSVLDQVEQAVVPGVAPTVLDAMATDLIRQQSCEPAFLGFKPRGHTEEYPAALCVSANEAVVHGLPAAEPLLEGAVVGIDLGLIYQDRYFLDSARTVAVGAVSEAAEQLLAVTRRSLELGIEAAKVGNTTGDIGAAIQQYVEGQGYTVIRQLVGHGVGFAVHEPPPVPNYGEVGQGDKLTDGLVIAIEPMVTTGDPSVTEGADGWTVVTASGNPAAHFEHTVAITEAGPQILT